MSHSHLGDVGDDGRERCELVVHLLPPLPLGDDVLLHARARFPATAATAFLLGLW